MGTRYLNCHWCGSDIEPPQRQTVSSLCKKCGEKKSKEVQKGWTVLTPHKQGPMFFSQAFAREAAKGINNKGGLVK
jgi:NMD protein affecting ribosome stability and mRNA decay